MPINIPHRANQYFLVSVLNMQVVNEYLVLKVGDEGIGISSKEQDKIFVRFYNNKNSKPGLSNGIGLSLTKELVELHHGHIALKSALGKGSTFTIEIPLDKECYLSDEYCKMSGAGIVGDKASWNHLGRKIYGKHCCLWKTIGNFSI